MMNYLKKYAEVIGRICSSTQPGKKMIQKMFYLMERKGVSFDLQYSIHYFGPYSSKLDNVLHALESNDVLSIDTTGITHIISMGDGKIEGEHLSPQEAEKVQFVIDRFSDKSALELEAITTLDYVAKHLIHQPLSDSLIIAGVKKIKGSKFSDEVLNRTLNILKEYEYLS